MWNIVLHAEYINKISFLGDSDITWPCWPWPSFKKNWNLEGISGMAVSRVYLFQQKKAISQV